MHELRPGLFQALDAHGLGCAQLLSKQADPKFFEQPAELGEARVFNTLAIRHKPPELLL